MTPNDSIMISKAITTIRDTEVGGLTMEDVVVAGINSIAGADASILLEAVEVDTIPIVDMDMTEEDLRAGSVIRIMVLSRHFSTVKR
jgi:hypothetical protein